MFSVVRALARTPFAAAGTALAAYLVAAKIGIVFGRSNRRLMGIDAALGQGKSGWTSRRPLGIAIIGGLLFSQVLTLYTTPVIYLAFDRLARRFGRGNDGGHSTEGHPEAA